MLYPKSFPHTFRHGKTPYELLHDKLPDLSFFHVFGALFYPTNDNENLGKLQPKVDIGIFIGYAPTKKAFQIYNRRTYELNAMASEQSSSGPALYETTPAIISLGLVLNPPSSTLKWTKDHPLENIIGQLARPVSTRLELNEQAFFCYYDAFLTSVEPKTYKDALTQSCWIEVIQEELNEFEFLGVWELVPRPDKVMIVTLMWIYKVKLDELGGLFGLWLINNKLSGKAVFELIYGILNLSESQYPEIHFSSQETSDKVFQANHSIQNEESFENFSSNQEKEEPAKESDICQLIRKECSIKASEEQKQKMEDTMLELVKICQEKEFLCIHDDINDLIESALNSKLLLINSNSQRLDKKEHEVKNAVEQPSERKNRNIQSLQNLRVVHKRSISFNTSQISSIHAVAPILSTKEPEHLLSMRYEHLSITPQTEYDEVIESNTENLLPIPSECEVALEDKRRCDLPISENSPVCDNHSDTFSDSKIDDDISNYDVDFEDIEYVEASLSDLEIVSVEEENVVQQEEEEVDFEDISQIQDIVLREKLLSITRLISNIESLNDNSTPDRVLDSFAFDNSLLDNFSPDLETFCDHTKETRTGNTTHANYSLFEYDSFCFEPDQERLINLMKNDIFDDLSNDPLLKEVDLFLFDNSIPPGIENIADDPEGDIHFLEELLIDNSILSHESFDSNFEVNLSIPRPPPEPPDVETDTREEILVVMIDRDKFDDDYQFFIFDKVFSFLSAKSEDTIFDPGISN
nr:retrovirus-related Pol polyprotein from transposon TNT 1-94 [Tanacetum cinerariifolium]